MCRYVNAEVMLDPCPFLGFFIGFFHWHETSPRSQTGQTVSAMDPPTSASHLTTQGIKCKPPCLGCSVSSGDRAQGFGLGDKLSTGLQNTLVQFQTQRGFKDSQRGARGQLSSFLTGTHSFCFIPDPSLLLFYSLPTFRYLHPCLIRHV